MDDYRLIRKLGEGTYGQVYEAQHRVTQQTVAVKVIHPTAVDGSSDDDIAASNRELQALQLCQHPNVITLHTHFVHRPQQHTLLLSLVLTHMKCDLAQLLAHCQHTATALTLPIIRLIAHQLLTAIAHIHSLGVLHRDIKPSNVLIAHYQPSHPILPPLVTPLLPSLQPPLPPPPLSVTAPSHSIQLADFGQASVVSGSVSRPLSPAV